MFQIDTVLLFKMSSLSFVFKILVILQPKSFYNWTLDNADSLGIAIFKKRVAIGMAVNDTSNSIMKATAYYNGQPFHARPISVR